MQIGTSACARALSACFDSLCDGAIDRELTSKIGTVFGKYLCKISDADYDGIQTKYS